MGPKVALWHIATRNQSGPRGVAMAYWVSINSAGLISLGSAVSLLSVGLTIINLLRFGPS